MIKQPISNINYRKIRITEEPSKAEKMLLDLKDRSGDDFVYRHIFFQKLPDKIAIPIADEYRKIYLNKGRREANLYLLQLDKDICESPINFNLTDSDMCDIARAKSRTCQNIKLNIKNEQQLYRALTDYASRYGISAPTLSKKMSLGSAINRLCDESWWRRQIRRLHGQALETFSIHAGFVRKQRGIYASHETVFRRRQQKQRNRNILECTHAINELGDEYTLQELSDLSISNPKVRRGELMTRISGLEAVSKELGDVGMFYTITCPSSMHARFASSGDVNQNYDGTTPNEAQKYLADLWVLIRTALSNMNIEIYGIRVCEPNHDGTPHWHMMLFMEPGHVNVVTETIKKYALRKNPDEIGADKYRFDSKRIDWSKGTATGYIAKYISKNIDGEYVGEDSYGKDAIESSERVNAWAGVWNLRQFQFIGGPSIGIWRELRRLTIIPAGLMGDLYEAADDGDWAKFIMLLGGPRKSDQIAEISLLKVWSDKPNKYGEALGYMIRGVTFNGIDVETRHYTWEISFKPGSNVTLEDKSRGILQDSCRVSEKILHEGLAGLPAEICYIPEGEPSEVKQYPRGQFRPNPRGTPEGPQGRGMPAQV